MAVAKKFVLTLAFSSLILFSLAGNDARGVPGIDDQSAGELRYSDRHSAVSRLVTKFIERNHYSEPRVNTNFLATALCFSVTARTQTADEDIPQP